MIPGQHALNIVSRYLLTTSDGGGGGAQSPLKEIILKREAKERLLFNFFFSEEGEGECERVFTEAVSNAMINYTAVMYLLRYPSSFLFVSFQMET